jgi:hypothetical protein
MTPPNLKPWQWLAVGLVLGLIVGALRRFADEMGVADYGETINGRIDFERALVKDVKLADENVVRTFGDLTVYPEQLAGDAGTRRVYVVAGSFIGRPKTDPATGQIEAKVERRCFVADAGPYRSQGEGREYPSVMAYLDALRPAGVTYTYAWWHDGRFTVPVWTGAGVLAVGVVLPALLNLLAYGSFRAPREESDTVEAPAFAALPEAELVPVGSEGEQDADAFNAALEAQGGAVAEAPAAPAPSAPGVKPLRTTPVEAVAVDADHADKAFGTREDDFYPTERRTGSKPRAKREPKA